MTSRERVLAAVPHADGRQPYTAWQASLRTGGLVTVAFAILGLLRARAGRSRRFKSIYATPKVGNESPWGLAWMTGQAGLEWLLPNGMSPLATT